MMYLPKDVVLEILLRLPVRSLLRLVCVCREWRALIKSSPFQDKHMALTHARAEGDDVILFKTTPYTNHGNGKTFVTCCYRDYESLALSASDTVEPSNDFEISDNPPRDMIVINHVNGIFCVVEGDDWFNITLLNPALRELKKLTIPDLGFKCYTQGLGFGFDGVTNEYKVVAIVTLIEGGGHSHRHVALLYHLNINSWKILGDMPEIVSKYFPPINWSLAYIPTYFLGGAFGPPPCIFSRGSLHWLEIGNNFILTFNMSTEVFEEIPFPHAWKDYEHRIQSKLLTIERSTIALIAFTDPSHDVSYFRIPPHLDIWVMKDYGVRESWIKQHSIISLPVVGWPMSFLRKDKLFLQAYDGNLICYHLSQGQFYRHHSTGLRVETCNESFVSIKEL